MLDELTPSYSPPRLLAIIKNLSSIYIEPLSHKILTVQSESSKFELSKCAKKRPLLDSVSRSVYEQTCGDVGVGPGTQVEPESLLPLLELLSPDPVEPELVSVEPDEPESVSVAGTSVDVSLDGVEPLLELSVLSVADGFSVAELLLATELVSEFVAALSPVSTVPADSA